APGLRLHRAGRRGRRGDGGLAGVERAAVEGGQLAAGAVGVHLRVARVVLVLGDQRPVLAVVGGVARAVQGAEALDQRAVAQRSPRREALPALVDDALVGVIAGVGVVAADLADVGQPGVVLIGQDGHLAGAQVLVGADGLGLAVVGLRDQAADA